MTNASTTPAAVPSFAIRFYKFVTNALDECKKLDATIRDAHVCAKHIASDDAQTVTTQMALLSAYIGTQGRKVIADKKGQWYTIHPRAQGGFWLNVQLERSNRASVGF